MHGSESFSAVDYYADPYIYAANGFAALAFDKRGTGQSQGEYLQNFHVLSDDVVAAVRWLRAQPQIDGERIHLAGFSQGGWIAPLAAAKDGHIRSVLVGYGVMLPVTGEDRWGYFYALQQQGFGADAIAAADRVNAVIETPSLWLLAGQDSSAPTPWTVQELEKLQAAGRPVRLRVFPDADHGIMKFVQEPGGERRYTALEPDYYPAQIAWLREHSGSKCGRP